MDLIPVSDLAKRCGTSVRAIRHYEAIGLIERDSSFGSGRAFAYETIDLVNKIVALRDLGFSLEEIGVLLEKPLRPATDFRLSAKPPTRGDVLAKFERMYTVAKRLIREFKN